MTVEPKSTLVAIVDDDESVRSALRGLMKSAGLSAVSYVSAEEFLHSDRLHQTACLIADIRMAGMSGLELQASLKDKYSGIPIIFITAHGDEQMRLQAMKGGALEFLVKPFDDDVLLEKVRAALGDRTPGLL